MEEIFHAWILILNGFLLILVIKTNLMRPVFPCVKSGRDGRRYLEGRPGRTGILASVRMTAQDGLAGTAGVSGDAIFPGTSR